MQTVYAYIINKIYCVTRHIDERTRNAIIQVAMLFFACMFALRPSSDDIGNRMVLCSAVLIVILTMSINGNVQRVKWEKTILYPMVLFGIGIVAIGQLHYIGNGYMMYAMQLVFIMPVYYLVWISRGDYETLYDRVAIAFAYAGIIFFIYNFILATRGEFIIALGDRAAGSTNNPNFLGMIGLTMTIAAQYLSLRTKNWRQAAAFAISSGLGISLIIESASRAAMLSLIGSTIVLAIFAFRTRAQAEKGIYGKPIVLIICFIVLLVSLFAGLQIDDVQLRASQNTPDASNIKTAAVFDELVLTEIATEASEEETTPSDLDGLFSRLDDQDDINTFSSGRLAIWKTYLPYMNMLGNNYKQFKKEHPEFREPRAHNNFIDYAFRCGIPVAVLYLVFYMAIGIKALYWLISKKDRCAVRFYAIAIVGTYALYAMVEIATMTFIRAIPCLFFLLIAPLMSEGDEATKEQGTVHRSNDIDLCKEVKY